MASLTQDNNGNYRARKRLPDDVREAYGHRHGPRFEAKFSAPKTIGQQEATRRYGEWLAEAESRIKAIRDERIGTGRNLTRAEARKLAGEWYEWFIERRSETSLKDLERRRDEVNDAFKSGVVSERDRELIGTDELWRERLSVREAVRPVTADVAETAQFLALKKLALTADARGLFLDFLYEDLAAALNLLMRRAGGDYSADAYAKRFPKAVPKPEPTKENVITPKELFKKWVGERQPARGTIESWRYVFDAMQNHFEARGIASITSDEAKSWIKSLVTEERSIRYSLWAHTPERSSFSVAK